MKFFTVATLFLAGAIATPVAIDARSPTSDASVCPAGLFSNSQCCATFVLGLVGLDCTTPTGSISDPNRFRETCAKIGKQAGCCAIPVAGQGVLCQPVAGN